MLGSILRRPRAATAGAVESRADYPLSWYAYQQLFSFNGQQYSVPGPYPAQANKHLMRACGPVFAVLDRRSAVLGEARPMFQRWRKGSPAELFSSRELEILKRPWPGGTWRQLVSICDVDDALCGNSYWIRRGDRLIRLNPEWVTIVANTVLDGGVPIGEELVGYVVQQPGREATKLEPAEVAHYRPGAPIDNPFRGESWLASVALDASADIELTTYKGRYLKNGAMPSLAVTYEPTLSQAQLEEFIPLFNEKFTGALNAGKVMHFLGGKDVKTVGATLDQLAFKAVQGGGETRVAAAAGVPAVIAAFSEGMQGSSLNSGNYTATRRLFADAKIRPLLGSLCDAFSTLVPVPSDSRLWYTDEGVSFFQADVTDEATIRQARAATIRTLIESGWDPDAALQAAITGDFDALTGTHLGLTSVQLQPAADSGSVSSNGNGTMPPELEGAMNP